MLALYEILVLVVLSTIVSFLDLGNILLSLWLIFKQVVVTYCLFPILVYENFYSLGSVYLLEMLAEFGCFFY